MTQPSILVFSGSTRTGSVNTKLAETIASELSKLDCAVTHISLADYSLPIYDGDIEANEGVPDNAKALAKLMNDHDGFFIVSPEYNGSLTPLLKNTIDWISRVSEVDGEKITPYRGKVGAIAAASPGAMGGISMLYHKREILVRLGALIVSEQVAVGSAGSAFTDDGSIKDERTAGFLKMTCESLVQKTRLIAGAK